MYIRTNSPARLFFLSQNKESASPTRHLGWTSIPNVRRASLRSNGLAQPSLVCQCWQPRCRRKKKKLELFFGSIHPTDTQVSLSPLSPCVPRTANTYGLIKTMLTRRKKRQGGLEDLAAAGGLIARRVPAAGADVDVCIL